jgi:hypothetical protein
MTQAEQQHNEAMRLLLARMGYEPHQIEYKLRESTYRDYLRRLVEINKQPNKPLALRARDLHKASRRLLVAVGKALQFDRIIDWMARKLT